ncbi:MAG TPA: hypothetical protein ENK18_12270 [Deltaproteobacteria bacterium]|nr:hypothetical protein [Deltaproteobacteria bacterium]
MIATLALMPAPALACSWDTPDGECDEHDHEVHVEIGVDDADASPRASVVSGGDHRESDLVLQYGMQFLPSAPAHQLYGRLFAENDSYFGAEIRYMPASDLLWSGRIGAGLDLFGEGGWDLSLGLWLGSAGAWERSQERPVLYNAPIAGTEVALGIDGENIYARYRWLAGLGGGPIDDLLTEQELTVGYKVLPQLHVFGQYLILSPGKYHNRSGVGLGVRAVL